MRVARRGEGPDPAIPDVRSVEDWTDFERTSERVRRRLCGRPLGRSDGPDGSQRWLMSCGSTVLVFDLIDRVGMQFSGEASSLDKLLAGIQRYPERGEASPNGGTEPPHRAWTCDAYGHRVAATHDGVTEYALYGPRHMLFPSAVNRSSCGRVPGVALRNSGAAVVRALREGPVGDRGLPGVGPSRVCGVETAIRAWPRWIESASLGADSLNHERRSP